MLDIGPPLGLWGFVATQEGLTLSSHGRLASVPDRVAMPLARFLLVRGLVGGRGRARVVLPALARLMAESLQERFLIDMRHYTVFSDAM